MMAFPTSVYRLQFRDGMDFDRACTLVPYWQNLGIGALYASPLFTARAGSLHGYDITCPDQIDPVLGGIEGLRRLSRRLKQAGMGLILDIVPNHMAFSLESPWLQDVLRHGQKSAYADYFDINWDKGRLVLPFLTAPFEELTGDDAPRIEQAPDGPFMVCGPLRVALAPGTDPGIDMAKVHAAQSWRLAPWQEGLHGLTHRRFFNVTELIGLCVEIPEVFEATHALIFDLVAQGLVQGLRVDHVDGLADPAQYLDSLAQLLPETPIWVEKILTADETLRPWPVAGTTGYIAARIIEQVLTDQSGARQIRAQYQSFTKRHAAFSDVVAKAKAQMLSTLLQAEMHQLVDLALAVFPKDAANLRAALRDLVIAMPQHRSYVADPPVTAPDRALLTSIAKDDLQARLVACLCDDPSDAARALCIRFQQVTGAAMAKAQEDTAFFRYVPLLCANEVGAEPDAMTLSPARFHHAMIQRASDMPQGLTLTSSHDTKRDEDARMRIGAITHHPAPFLGFVQQLLDIAPDIDPNMIWYIAQTVLAMDAKDPDRADRIAAHMEKALREAKELTDWTAPNEEAEAQVMDFARQASHSDLAGLSAILDCADRLSLAQVALKLTVPGIPDIYQGTEIFTHRLGDPDNRVPPDFDTLAARLSGLSAYRPKDRHEDRHSAKMALITRLLHLRARLPEVFLEGDYIPLDATGGLVVFVRAKGPDAVLVMVDLGGGGGQVFWPDWLAPAHTLTLPKGVKAVDNVLHFSANTSPLALEFHRIDQTPGPAAKG